MGASEKYSPSKSFLVLLNWTPLPLPRGPPLAARARGVGVPVHVEVCHAPGPRLPAPLGIQLDLSWMCVRICTFSDLYMEML